MTLSRAEARAFYDRFGLKQDRQRFYEDRAIADLVGHASFGTARSVVEFGCGTGRLAETLLELHLPGDARYVGVDISRTMVSIAQDRLARFGSRAEVRLTDGSPSVDAESGGFDRFLSTYVLDLLSEDGIGSVIAEAHRLLVPGGVLILASLSHGTGLASRLTERAWLALYSTWPTLVGGCRPIALTDFVEGSGWNIRHRAKIVQLGIVSEVLVARRRGPANAQPWGR